MVEQKNAPAETSINTNPILIDIAGKLGAHNSTMKHLKESVDRIESKQDTQGEQINKFVSTSETRLSLIEQHIKECPVNQAKLREAQQIQTANPSPLAALLLNKKTAGVAAGGGGIIAAILYIISLF